MWRELISRTSSESEVFDGSSAEAIAAIERSLGQPVPADLKDLLIETDGVVDEYGTDIVWNARRIVEDNLTFRSNSSFAELYAPFDGMMFFGDNGGGDQFAFVAASDETGVIVWDHETDERYPAAVSLEQYLTRSLENGGGDWHRNS